MPFMEKDSDNKTRNKAHIDEWFNKENTSPVVY